MNKSHESASSANRAVKQTIIVTGTPGTGKTALAKELSLLLHKKQIDVNLFVKSEDLSEGYDKARDTAIVSPRRLNKALISLIKDSKGQLIIDSHMAHFLPSKYVELCIVTKCSLKELKKRLEKKGYSASKVRENLDAEIFDVCLSEAKEKGHKILVLDTTKKRPKSLAKEALVFLKNLREK